jgi:hypothetical protein
MLTGITHADRGANGTLVVKQCQQTRHENTDTSAMNLGKPLRDEGLHGSTPGIVNVDQAGLALAGPGAGRGGWMTASLS